MAGTPKHASARRRRNIVPGARTLVPQPSGAIDIPDLPDLRQWHPLTLEQWASIHRSPMYPEYDESDIQGLVMIAVMWDDYWRAASLGEDVTTLSREVRQAEARYGLSPYDRRRLSWVIDQGEQAEAATNERRNRKAVREAENKGKPKVDPRTALAG